MTIADDPLWNDLLARWREALTVAVPTTDSAALALRAFADLLARCKTEVAQISAQFAVRAEAENNRTALAAIEQLTAQFLTAVAELNDHDRAALITQSQIAEIKIKLKKVSAKKSATGKNALSDDDLQRLKNELPKQSSREAAAEQLNKYTIPQLSKIAQTFGVRAASKKKADVVALIVNIALGDSVLAQIVGGKNDGG